MARAISDHTRQGSQHHAIWQLAGAVCPGFAPGIDLPQQAIDLEVLADAPVVAKGIEEGLAQLEEATVEETQYAREGNGEGAEAREERKGGEHEHDVGDYLHKVHVRQRPACAKGAKEEEEEAAVTAAAEAGRKRTRERERGGGRREHVRKMKRLGAAGEKPDAELGFS